MEPGPQSPARRPIRSCRTKLFSEGFGAKNFGHIGATASVNGDNPYIGGPQYDPSQETPADVYIIMLGTNDSKPCNWDPEACRAGLEELIDTYRGLNPNAEGCAAIARYVYEQIQEAVRAIRPQQ